MGDLIATIAIYALPVVFAITLHEAAHGYVARHFGDLTAYQAGRITLNPLRHIDPVGTVLVPLALLAISRLAGSSGILFGWAKPVPVNFGNLRHPKRDMLWVAAAGPGANLFMAVCWALTYKMAAATAGSLFSSPLSLMAAAGIEINVMLMALNLVPIPPLDGGRIAVSLLPHNLAYQLARLEPYGLILLLVLLFTGLLQVLIGPLVSATLTAMTWLIHT
jgi:Zn-dependent protease